MLVNWLPKARRASVGDAYRRGYDPAFLELAASIREIGANRVSGSEYLEDEGLLDAALTAKALAESDFLEAKGLLDYACEIKGKTESPNPTEN